MNNPPNPDIKHSFPLTTTKKHGLKPIGEWTIGEVTNPGDTNPTPITDMSETPAKTPRQTEAAIAKLIRENKATEPEKKLIRDIQEELTRRANIPALEI